MGKYQIFETDHQGTRTLHHSLDLANAEKLARAYGLSSKEKVYGFMPNHDIDEHDVDFSNDILNDMKKEEIKEEVFLSEFLRRKKQIKLALGKMLQEAKNSKLYHSMDEFIEDITKGKE